MANENEGMYVAGQKPSNNGALHDNDFVREVLCGSNIPFGSIAPSK